MDQRSTAAQQGTWVGSSSRADEDRIDMTAFIPQNDESRSRSKVAPQKSASKQPELQFLENIGISTQALTGKERTAGEHFFQYFQLSTRFSKDFPKVYFSLQNIQETNIDAYCVKRNKNNHPKTEKFCISCLEAAEKIFESNQPLKSTPGHHSITEKLLKLRGDFPNPEQDKETQSFPNPLSHSAVDSSNVPQENSTSLANDIINEMFLNDPTLARAFQDSLQQLSQDFSKQLTSAHNPSSHFPLPATLTDRNPPPAPETAILPSNVPPSPFDPSQVPANPGGPAPQAECNQSHEATQQAGDSAINFKSTEKLFPILKWLNTTGVIIPDLPYEKFDSLESFFLGLGYSKICPSINLKLLPDSELKAYANSQGISNSILLKHFQAANDLFENNPPFKNSDGHKRIRRYVDNIQKKLNAPSPTPQRTPRSQKPAFPLATEPLTPISPLQRRSRESLTKTPSSTPHTPQANNRLSHSARANTFPGTLKRKASPSSTQSDSPPSKRQAANTRETSNHWLIQGNFTGISTANPSAETMQPSQETYVKFQFPLSHFPQEMQQEIQALNGTAGCGISMQVASIQLERVLLYTPPKTTSNGHNAAR